MRKTDWLQLFAQPEEPAQAGENAGDTAPDAGERQEDFEDLIRGRYKADFDARVQKILDGRLRGLRQEVAQLRQWERERDLRHQAAMGRLSRQEPEIQRSTRSFWKNITSGHIQPDFPAVTEYYRSYPHPLCRCTADAFRIERRCNRFEQSTSTFPLGSYLIHAGCT